MIFKLALCFFISINGGFMTNSAKQSLKNYFDKAKTITIYYNGETDCYFKGDDKFELILKSLKLTTKDSQEMPAFAVSLDSETKSKLQSGIWLELNFLGAETHNELPFESLLIEVNQNYEGINIIRKNNNKYDGRCFYLNLKTNMSQIVQTVQNLSH